ncbi:MAG: hypothetical protein QM730_21980 [Anaerolineales bacterium]
MQKTRLEHLIRNIENTQENEISCSECFDLVSLFVEMELDRQEPASKIPGIKQHIDQCPACRQEYEILRDLQVLENEHQLPSSDDLKRLIL